MIIRNAIRCNICGDEIESTYRHDYVECNAEPALSTVGTTICVAALRKRGVTQTSRCVSPINNWSQNNA